MANLPPVTLGVIFLTAFLAAFVARRLLEPKLVLSAAGPDRPKKQFILDFCIYLSIGAAVVVYDMIAYSFPVLFSGVKVILGTLSVGFFLSLDTALARERMVILEALQQGNFLSPPGRLFSMTRKFSLVAFLTAIFVTIVITMVISRDFAWLADAGQDAVSLARMEQSVITEMFFIMAMLLAMVSNLIFSYSRNLKLLFDNQTGVLDRVSTGDLTGLVPVVTKDEFGVIAARTNTMIHGLRDRSRLLTSLKLAEEVQQNLLPQKFPEIKGVDIAGRAIYSNETGGDYYDLLSSYDGTGSKFSVVVGDVTGHGVAAALLMTTVRALIRSRSLQPGLISEIVSDVNKHLCLDIAETGRFVTLFYLSMDLDSKSLQWVRAGHDPAIFYDSRTGNLEELHGPGIALGVDAGYSYAVNEKTGLRTDQLVVIGTDGIWETRNPEGNMMGKNPIYDLIRLNAHRTAEEITEALTTALASFRKNENLEDDVTLVVIKITGMQT